MDAQSTNTQLTLVVKEKTLGSLVTNALEIKDFVAAKLETYSVDNYQGDEKQAAKDKAELNAAAKKLNDERIKLEKEFNAPFQEFKSIVDETCKMITSASAKLDAIVKEKERREKDAKRQEIQEIWNSKNFNLVNLDRIFNSKWLNKSVKMSAIEKEIDSIINSINTDLQTLDSYSEDTTQLKEIYLSTLSLQAALNKGAELKANRERIAAMEAQKQAEAKKAEQAAINQCPAKEPEQLELRPVNAVNKPVYRFAVCGNEHDLATIAEIANYMNLVNKPLLSFEGNAAEMCRFKELMEKNGLYYAKNQILVLDVKQKV